MQNPFEELNTKIDEILAINHRLLEALKNPTQQKISFKDFCTQYKISRPTAYSWNERGLIRIEKVGGRNYVLIDSISIPAKKTLKTT